MEAEDLMIGDWVLTLDSTHKEKVFAQVDAIEEGKDSILVAKVCSNWFVDIDWIEPIPLTEEILEKNGWINEHFGTQRQEWWLDKTKFPVVKYSTNSHFQHNGIVFSYVHQLQHALRLCGIKKEIIL